MVFKTGVVPHNKLPIITKKCICGNSFCISMNNKKYFCSDACRKKNASNFTWNKGLTKENSERVHINAINISKAMKGRKKSLEHIANLKEAIRKTFENGRISPLKGKHNYKIVGKRNGMYGKKRPDFVKYVITHIRTGKDNPHFGKKHTNEAILKMKTKRKEWYFTHISPRLGVKLTEETKNKISDKHKKRYLNPICKHQYLMRLLKNNLPNRPEIKVANLLKTMNKPMEYVGNGKWWFNFKNQAFNPDFIDNTNKKIIEVYGDYWHTRKDSQEKDVNRIEAYRQRGYDILVIWEKELLNINEVINKIHLFYNDNMIIQEMKL